MIVNTKIKPVTWHDMTLKTAEQEVIRGRALENEKSQLNKSPNTVFDITNMLQDTSYTNNHAL